jgi:hypothetical protein
LRVAFEIIGWFLQCHFVGGVIRAIDSARRA